MCRSRSLSSLLPSFSKTVFPIPPRPHCKTVVSFCPCDRSISCIHVFYCSLLELESPLKCLSNFINPPFPGFWWRQSRVLCLCCSHSDLLTTHTQHFFPSQSLSHIGSLLLHLCTNVAHVVLRNTGITRPCVTQNCSWMVSTFSYVLHVRSGKVKAQCLKHYKVELKSQPQKLCVHTWRLHVVLLTLQTNLMFDESV